MPIGLGGHGSYPKDEASNYKLFRWLCDFHTWSEKDPLEVPVFLFQSEGRVELVAPVGKIEFKDFPVEVIDPPSKQVLAVVDMESVL